GIGWQIGCRDAIEYVLQQASKGEGASQANDRAPENQLKAASKCHAQDASTVCAQGHAYADFPCPLRDRVRHQAVEANGSEHERQRRKQAKQLRREAWLRDRSIADIVQSAKQ